MTDEAATPGQRYQVRNGPYITVIYDTIENKQMLVSDVCQMLNDHQAVLAAANEQRLFAENAVIELNVKLGKAERALQSIANNTCCGTCQEAALVASRALGESTLANKMAQLTPVRREKVEARVAELKAELAAANERCKVAERETERLFQQGLEWSNKCMDLQQQLAAARAEAVALREALKQIAKPALGGKQQQWLAQQALAAVPPQPTRTWTSEKPTLAGWYWLKEPDSVEAEIVYVGMMQAVWFNSGRREQLHNVQGHWYGPLDSPPQE